MKTQQPCARAIRVMSASNMAMTLYLPIQLNDTSRQTYHANPSKRRLNKQTHQTCVYAAPQFRTALARPVGAKQI